VFGREILILQLALAALVLCKTVVVETVLVRVVRSSPARKALQSKFCDLRRAMSVFSGSISVRSQVQPASDRIEIDFIGGAAYGCCLRAFSNKCA
jgi:hypothetical protein